MKTTFLPPSVRSELEARQTTSNVVKPRKSVKTGQNTLFNYILIALFASALIVSVVCCVVSPANSY